MNAADTIQAAIAKLERLKAESTQPTGGTSWVQGNDRKPLETRGEIYSGPLSDISSDITSWISPADAELIVTLHATIEPQLAILRVVEGYNELLLISVAGPEINLARAILGSDA